MHVLSPPRCSDFRNIGWWLPFEIKSVRWILLYSPCDFSRFSVFTPPPFCDSIQRHAASPLLALLVHLHVVYELLQT